MSPLYNPADAAILARVVTGTPGGIDLNFTSPAAHQVAGWNGSSGKLVLKNPSAVDANDPEFGTNWLGTGDAGAGLRAARDYAISSGISKIVLSGIYELRTTDPSDASCCLLVQGNGIEFEMTPGSILRLGSALPVGVQAVKFLGSRSTPDPTTLGTASGVALLTADVQPGDTFINVDTTASFAVGDVFEIASNRPYEPFYEGCRLGERLVVKTIVSGTQIETREKIVGGPYYFAQGPAAASTTTAITDTGIGAGPITQQVVSTAAFEGGGRCWIDQEFFTYTVQDATHLVLTRAQDNTAIANHVAGSTVTQRYGDQPMTFLTVAALAGDTTLTVATTRNFPVFTMLKVGSEIVYGPRATSSTHLTADIDEFADVVPVLSTAAFGGAGAGAGIAAIGGSEQFSYTDTTSNTFIGCVRGINDTGPQPHATGEAVGFTRFTTLQRAVRGTTAAAHSVGDVVSNFDGAWITKVVEQTKSKFHGGKIVGRGTGFLDLGVTFSQCDQPVFGSDIFNCEQVGANFTNCNAPLVEPGTNFHGINASLGYGLTFSLCTQDGRAAFCNFYDCRHAVTQGGGTASTGIPRRNHFVNNTVRCSAHVGDAIDLHPSSEFANYSSNTVYDSASQGMNMEAARFTCNYNEIWRCRHNGIAAYNQTLYKTEYEIVGNQVHWPGGGVVAGLAAGISIFAAGGGGGQNIRWLRVMDNSVYGSTGVGVGITAVTWWKWKNATITGNVDIASTYNGKSYNFYGLGATCVVKDNNAYEKVATAPVMLLTNCDAAVVDGVNSSHLSQDAAGICVSLVNCNGTRVKNVTPGPTGIGVNANSGCTNLRVSDSDLSQCLTPTSLSTGAGHLQRNITGGRVKRVSANYTVLPGDPEIIACTATGKTMTLQALANYASDELRTFKNESSGTMTIAAAGGQTIEGNATLVLPAGGYYKIYAPSTGGTDLKVAA